VKGPLKREKTEAYEDSTLPEMEEEGINLWLKLCGVITGYGLRKTKIDSLCPSRGKDVIGIAV
jgi:hypothetical protein